MSDHHTTTPDAAAAWEARDTPRPSRRDAATDAGWDPHPDDTAPAPAHLRLPDDDPWMVALAGSVREAARLRQEGLA